MAAMAALEADALLTAADVACIQDVHPEDTTRAGQFFAIKQHPRDPCFRLLLRASVLPALRAGF
jgi:hypothetical protein